MKDYESTNQRLSTHEKKLCILEKLKGEFDDATKQDWDSFNHRGVNFPAETVRIAKIPFSRYNLWLNECQLDLFQLEGKLEDFKKEGLLIDIKKLDPNSSR